MRSHCFLEALLKKALIKNSRDCKIIEGVFYCAFLKNLCIKNLSQGIFRQREAETLRILAMAQKAAGKTGAAEAGATTQEANALIRPDLSIKLF